MKALPFGFGVIIAALVSLIIVGVAVVRADLAALHGASKENLFWSAAQVEREFNALQVAVAQHAVDPQDDGANVRHHFDLLWSRIEIFQEGDVGRRLVSREPVHATIDALYLLLQELDPVVQSLGTDTFRSKEIGERLAASSAGIRRTTINVLHTDQARSAVIRDEMRFGLLMTAGAVLLSLLLAIGAAVVFRGHARRSAALAREAEEAGESKIRFFSMMSHELRTPLNGLLGALNLLRDLPAGADRTRLLDEANGSAHRLSDVLTDAVALGADDAAPPVNTVFSAHEIAAAQRSLLEGELNRRNARLLVDMTPAYATGDLNRLSNATSHLLRSVLQRGAATELRLQIGIDAAAIRLTVSSDTETPPEAFGETLARGLLEASGGSLDRTECGWCLTMPALRIVPKARLYLSSSAMAGLYGKLLAAQGIGVVDSDDDDFQIALTDAMLDEATRQSLRERYPRSRIIACGTADLVPGFDAVLKSPSDLGPAIASVLSHPPLAA